MTSRTRTGSKTPSGMRWHCEAAAPAAVCTGALVHAIVMPSPQSLCVFFYSSILGDRPSLNFNLREDRKMQHPPFRRGARALLFFTFLSFLFVAAGHAQKPTTSTPTIISCPKTLQVTGLMHAAQLPGGWSA